MLDAALQLAERAVVDNGVAQRPRILDTLAEVHFQLGHRAEAVATIDEAISRDPGRDYYREQRRRFLGEARPGGSARNTFLEERQTEDALPRKPGLSVGRLRREFVAVVRDRDRAVEPRLSMRVVTWRSKHLQAGASGSARVPPTRRAARSRRPASKSV